MLSAEVTDTEFFLPSGTVGYWLNSEQSMAVPLQDLSSSHFPMNHERWAEQPIFNSRGRPRFFFFLSFARQYWRRFILLSNRRWRFFQQGLSRIYFHLVLNLIIGALPPHAVVTFRLYACAEVSSCFVVSFERERERQRERHTHTHTRVTVDNNSFMEEVPLQKTIVEDSCFLGWHAISTGKLLPVTRNVGLCRWKLYVGVCQQTWVNTRGYFTLLH
jgi:hypothetical protein